MGHTKVKLEKSKKGAIESNNDALLFENKQKKKKEKFVEAKSKWSKEK